MRVVCGKDELAEKLGVVGRGVSTRTSVQILAGIMVRAAGGRLHLSATDMEISVRDSLEAQVEEEGAVVVPGRLLVDIVRLLPAGEVTLEHRADEGVARLACGSASYQLNTYAAEDFPRLPEIEPESAFTVDREVFLDTISRVGRSASRDESRPVLTGILVRFEGDKLVMAATDSYRLSVKETTLPAGPGLELDCEFLIFAVGNARSTGGGTRITPRALVTDGLIDLCIVEAMPRADFAKLLMRIKKGDHLDEPRVRYVQLPSVTIAADGPVTVNVDGESSEATTLTYRARPKDLRIHLPHLPEEEGEE